MFVIMASFPHPPLPTQPPHKPPLKKKKKIGSQMSIIFSEDSLQDLKIPCVAQSFVNHDAILYKIMMIGCKQIVIKRPSIRNFYPGSK